MQLIKAIPITKIVFELLITALIAGCLVLACQFEDPLLRVATTAICIGALLFRTHSVYFAGLTDGVSAIGPMLRAMVGDIADSEDICFCGECDDKKKISIVVAKDEEKTK